MWWALTSKTVKCSSSRLKTGRQEPVSQLQEIRRHGREGLNLFLAFDAEASYNRISMHIKTAAARI
jgi:hypothetical protein